MRIVAGEWKGRLLAAPRGRSVRPTPERVREAWMSILQNDLPGARVLDLFAGTGALGLEALSRGASFTDFVDHDALSLHVLRQNIEALGAADRCAVHRADALSYAAVVASRAPAATPSPEGDTGPHAAYEVCFADPPYRQGLASRLAGLWLDAPFSTIFGVEHESKEELPGGGDRRRYGDTAITIYRT